MNAIATSNVKIQRIDSELFDIQFGVTQEDFLSPLLFIILMDKCLRNKGPRMYEEETSNIPMM